MTAIVSVRNLRKDFGSFTALDGIDLDVAEGEVLCIIGPSGSGKSTLIRCINLLETFDPPGEVVVNGITVRRGKELTSVRTEVGMVFQSFNLVPVLSALENVMLPLQILDQTSVTTRDRAVECLNQVGLDGLSDNRPSELSGGQQQRVALARALSTRPKLVIADEPTANLDTETAFGIIDLMQAINRDFATTFVFATHDERLLTRVTRRIRLVDGRIAEGG